MTVAGLVIPGVVTAKLALAGFGTPSWLMILAPGAVTAAVARSGLLYRLAILSLERMPSSYLTQSLVLSTAGVLLTTGITSGFARMALGVPIARGIADPMSYERESRRQIDVRAIRIQKELLGRL